MKTRSVPVHRVVSAAVLLCCAGATFGQTFVSPGGAETSGLNTALRSLPRQYMEYFDETQLNSVPGPIKIVGIRLRIAALPQPPLAIPTPWPAVALNFPSYEVQLSKPSAVVTGAAGGAQFPTLQPWGNYQDAATLTTVFSGPLVIAANNFPYTSDNFAVNGPNAFAPVLTFTTPYLHTPGSGLVMYIKHPGSGTATDAFMANVNFAPETTDAVSALDSVAAAPTGFSSPLIFEFVYRTAGRLIAIDSSRAVSEIDMLTGAKTPVSTAAAAASTTAGLAYDRATNTVYLTSTGNDSLFKLDIATGNVTLVGAYGDAALVMHGLEWDSSTNTLYGASSHNGGLYKIDTTTGVATLVGLTGLASFTNLGYNSTTDVMYATNSGTDSFYTVNRATGAATLIGALIGPTNPNGLAFNPDNGLMYLVDNSTDNLYTINLASGAATLIGSNGAGNLLGLVYIPDPIATPCYANCDGSSVAPILNALDFSCFLTKFAASDPYANCDGSTTAPVLNALDFGCFLTKFAAGCT